MNLAIFVNNTQFRILIHAGCAYMMARPYQGCWPGPFIIVHLDKHSTDPAGCQLFAENLMGTA
jgi:hypothetical protein